ncbi:MAG: T9SS type A sorting domain-containing protein [Bacteroidales bacterium]|nr:T9SS type A sorting domain-containing protein [Bacteroidales bacterium]
MGEAYSYDAAGPYDILFVKADLNGNATSITTFEQPSNNLKVFPNPTSDILSVNLLPIGESEYTIIDANGREILKGKTQSNQIGVSLLPAGYYQLLWKNDGNIYHARFVKE